MTQVNRIRASFRNKREYSTFNLKQVVRPMRDELVFCSASYASVAELNKHWYHHIDFNFFVTLATETTKLCSQNSSRHRITKRRRMEDECE